MHNSSDLIYRAAEPDNRLDEAVRDFTPVVKLRYLPPKRLAGWDLRYESGIDHLIYVQSLIEEE